jgi:hypothetical protein
MKGPKLKISKPPQTNAYLILMVDGECDTTFIVANQKEWDALEFVDMNDQGINYPFFDPFMEDDTEESKRRFYDFKDVFDYVNSNKLILKDGFKTLVY